jgi:pimeloyl-ACP methyl ester carboxylesterase
MTFPPLPSLERRHLRADQAGSLEALVPASEPYICADPYAPALLLVPGLGLDGLALIRQLPLGALAHLHLFQMPNLPADGEKGMAGFARHVEEYIRAKKLDERPGGLILGGNSMGGAISMLIASRERVKLRGLVLMGTYGSRKHIPAVQRLAAPLAYVIPMAVIRRVLWRMAGGARMYVSSPEDGQWMSRPLIRRSFGYYGRAVGALTSLELLEAAQKIDIPTLVVHGTHDNVLKPAAGEELARTIPNAKLKWIENARHSLFFTHADAVNAAVAEFVGSLRHENVGALK